MSKFTLDDAIKHCLEVAERYETRAKMIDRRKLGFALENPTACHKCATEHRQLAEWLAELKKFREVYGVCPSYELCIPECKEGCNAQIAEYKRLLKVAVEDIQDMLYQVDSVTVCTHCIHTTAICYGGSDCEHEAKWTHLNEALALIGEEDTE